MLAKLGLGVRLSEEESEMQLYKLNGSFFVASAIIHETGKDAAYVRTNADSNTRHFGLNLGTEREEIASTVRQFLAGMPPSGMQ